MLFDTLIYFSSLLLFVLAGSNDVLVSLISPIGTGSINRRLLIICILFSIILSYFQLKYNGETYQTYSKQQLLNPLQFETFAGFDLKCNIYPTSFLIGLVFTTFSIISGFVLPLDTVLVPFFYGYFSTHEYLLNYLPNNLFSIFLLTYLVMPAVSGALTWFIYRILILGVIYSNEEEKFNTTLEWCGIFYPTAASAFFTLLFFKVFPFEENGKLIYGLILMAFFWVISFLIFKLIISASIKRRAFLLYPQEYAVYLEKSEKSEQGDREARGFGPKQDYLPKSSGINGTNFISSTGKPPLQSSLSMKDSYSGYETGFSPSVLTGKLAINSKRAEELFSPILNVIFVVSLLVYSNFESSNLLKMLKASNNKYATFLWPIMLAMLIGGVILSDRHGRYLSHNIISDMRLSQAFSIQLGILLTITISSLNSIRLAPTWYLLASISAVCSTSKESHNDRDQKGLKHLHMLETSSLDEETDRNSFRHKLLLIFLLWICCIGFSFSAGFFS